MLYAYIGLPSQKIRPSEVGPTDLDAEFDPHHKAPLRFGRLADFSADEGATEFPFMKEISGMCEARKAGERF